MMFLRENYHKKHKSYKFYINVFLRKITGYFLLLHHKIFSHKLDLYFEPSRIEFASFVQVRGGEVANTTHANL